MSCQNSFSAPWHRFYISLELYWRDEHHSSRKHSISWCCEDGRVERCLTRHSKSPEAVVFNWVEIQQV